MLTALCHSDANGWLEVDDPAKISDLLEQPGTVCWGHADVTELSPRDVATIAEEFSLDPLAVEDATHLGQRPKLEAYEGHLFTVMHQLDLMDGQLEAFQIACFIGPRWVVTLHERSGRTVDEALARCRRGVRAEGQGPSFVMHALLDAIVDDYERHADRLEEGIEEIEEIVLRDPGRPLQQQLYSLKQQLSRLRRYALPGERVLASVLEPQRYQMITDRTAAHFRDVHDHMLRILDQVRNIEDLVNAVLDLQRSEQTQTLNEATKRLSGWAAIIAVPTFIASVYGMNFALVPEEGELLGFFFALGVMVATGLGLYAFFKRKGWI